jgi:hypothetical protein
MNGTRLARGAVLLALLAAAGCAGDFDDTGDAESVGPDGADPGQATLDEELSEDLALGVAEMKLVTPQCTHAGPAPSFNPCWVPLANNGSDSCWMDRGNVSAGVAALQFALRDCWGYDVDIDSDFGPQTQGALRALQQRLGIDDDGVYGPQTRGAMGLRFSGTYVDGCAIEPL